jgi:hypothetical protein
MPALNRKLLLLATALVEAATGLCLLFLPDVPFNILLGLEQASVEAGFVARIAGTALLAIGIASFMARADAFTPAQRGLLTGILVYNAVVAVLLTYAGVVLKMAGVLLWPAFALHTILAIWCLGCLRQDGIGKI